MSHAPGTTGFDRYRRLSAVVDAFPFRLMVAAMLGWLDRRQQETVAYPMEEDRLLRKLAYLISG